MKYSSSIGYQREVSSLFWLRSGEAYLNLAEAEAYMGHEEAARNAINTLRENRYISGASDMQITSSGSQLITDIRDERKRELLGEGHRWFDMIRINNGNYAIEFLKSIGKNQVTKERLLLPIPQTEMDSNNLMTQNPGY